MAPPTGCRRKKSATSRVAMTRARTTMVLVTLGLLAAVYGPGALLTDDAASSPNPGEAAFLRKNKATTRATKRVAMSNNQSVHRGWRTSAISASFVDILWLRRN
jgi:hypothetical protein